MKVKILIVSLAIIAFANMGFTADSLSEKAAEDLSAKQKKSVKFWLAGDSTVADYSLEENYLKKKYPITGWGQVFQPMVNGENLLQLKPLVNAGEIIVDDRAKGGRSTRTFFEEGRWHQIYDLLQPGDLVMIQFGHNDAAVGKTERYVNLVGYKEYLRLYVNQTRQKGGIPVLITPVARNYPWVDGQLQNVHGEYPAAMKEIAAELSVDLIDLNRLSMDFFSSKGQDFCTKNYFMNFEAGKFEAYPEGSKDNTHFQPAGATEVARLVHTALVEIAEFRNNTNLTVAGKYDFVVAADGSGNAKTVQEAINAVPDFRKNRTTIFIKNGIYKEKLVLPASKTNVSFIGENPEKTILTFDDFAQKKNRFNEEIGTTGSTSFFVFGDGFRAENITFENSAGPVGQAVAVRITGDQVVFSNCRFLGFQDTLYPQGENSRQYYRNCYIEGTVDFIFGLSTAVFDNCTIFCKSGGYITAPSTNENTPFGFVFRNCTITGNAPEASFYLGRPWRPYGKSVFLNCVMEKLIRPDGWHNWYKPDAEKTSFFAEYKSTGPGAAGTRVPWAHQLTGAEAENYTLFNILGDWILEIVPENEIK